MALVMIAECASNTSIGRLSLSFSGGPVDQMYTFLSSLPQMTYFASSLKVA